MMLTETRKSMNTRNNPPNCKARNRLADARGDAVVAEQIVWLVTVLASWWWDRKSYAAKDLPPPESRQDVWGAVFWTLAILAVLLFLGW
jgi:hypothetical protein